MDSKSLLRQEREIARRHIGRFPWGSLLWAILNLAVWLALWPLVFFGGLSLWIAFPIACANVALCYLPSHEAQHDIYARPGERLRWLNEMVGTLSVIPLVTPYRLLRITHLEHHKHTNDPMRDPDYGTHAETAWGAIWASIRARAPRGAQTDSYEQVCKEQGREDILVEAALYQLGFYALLFALAWTGYAIEAAALWWLPRHIGVTYTHFYLSWAPHNPTMGKGRYKDTRAFRSWLGNFSSLGMQAHIVHHLHPRIPLLRTPKAYREMKPILEARGCQLD
jgi:beta-carotene hydroxylase